MSQEVNEVLDWRKFVSMYAKKHNVTYAQSMKECSGPNGVWAEYKKEHNLPIANTKSRAKIDKVPKNEEVEEEPSKKEEPKVVSKSKKQVSKPVAKRSKRVEKTVKVKAPPKGKKLKVRYVSESEESEESEIEVVNDNVEWGEDSDEDEYD